jgi:hypothetical protein
MSLLGGGAVRITHDRLPRLYPVGILAGGEVARRAGVVHIRG